MKKVCVVTASRSEYGLLRWIIDKIYHSKDLELQLVVSGSHLSPEQGLTCKQIEEDGYPIMRKIEFLLSTVSSVGIAKSMGVFGVSISDTFSDLNPDILVVLGDRYELLPICNAALIMGIPIAHISGGDITEGAIDNQIRNAITMMSSLHFPGTDASKKNIERMVNSTQNIYVTGETNIDNFVRNRLLSRTQLANDLFLDSEKKWILVTLHPETKKTIDENLNIAQNMMNVLIRDSDMEIIITQANADLGGYQMNELYSFLSRKYSFVHYIKSLGQLRYLSMMNEVSCIIGNSSSGIVEAPYLGIPVVNIGDRQKGRYLCSNIFCCGVDEKDIENSFNKAVTHEKFKPNYYFGNGYSSDVIIENIVKFLDIS